MRWPEHPIKIQGESLSSWLRRIGMVYGLNQKELMKWGLDIEGVHSHELDMEPPEELITALSMQTGERRESVKKATLAGMLPFLFDEIEVETGQRASMQLLRSRLAEGIPWFRKSQQRQVVGCRKCLESYPEAAMMLPWRVAILQSCPVHGLMLESAKVSRNNLDWLNDSSEEAPRVLRELDRRTWAAAMEGRDKWFLMLRSLQNRLRQRMNYKGRRREWQELVVERCPSMLMQRRTQREPARRWALVMATAVDLMKTGEMEVAGRKGFELSGPMREHEVLRENPQLRVTREAERWSAQKWK